MSECWRCGKEVAEGAKFCPSCGAPARAASVGRTPAAPPTPEPADPLAQTAPADADHMAALRAKFPALAPPKKEGKASTGSRGGTVPLSAQPDRVSRVTPPPATPAPSTPHGSVDPARAPSDRRIAHTVPDNAAVPLPGASQPVISPRAVSALEPPLAGPHGAQSSGPFVAAAPPVQPPAAYGAPAPQPAPPAWSQPTQPGPHGAPPPYGAPPPQPNAVRVGARVFVEWGDGNRYPGTVQQCAPGQCLVLFQDGQQRWVDARRVIPT